MAFIPPALSDPANVPLYFDALYTSMTADNQATVADIASLPASASFKGQRIYVQDIDAIVWYDDKTSAWQGYWKSFTPTIGGTTGATLACSYMIDPHEVVHVRLKITLTAAVTTTLSSTLPVAVNAVYTSAVSTFDGVLMYRDTSAGGGARQFGFAGYNGSDSIIFYYNATAATTSFITSGANPWTWASTDTIDGEFTYRRA